MSPPGIPLLHRFLLLYLEPVMALNGAFLAMFNPPLYLNTMTPTAVYKPEWQCVLDQLAATYLLFAWVEAVVLRVSGELKVWKAVMIGILLCDVVHLYATAKALGPDVFFNPTLWRWEDGVNIGILVGMMPVRLGVVFELGFDTTEAQKDKST
jgi:hypothetical protein